MEIQENKDVEDLKQLIENADYSSMTDFITRKTHKERMRLRQVYKQKFDKDLMSDLKSSFAGIYLKIILGLFTDPVEFDIDYIYKCLKEETSYNILIEIFASRPDWYLNKIKNLYQRKYNIELEEHIKEGTLDDFKKLLLQILQSERSTNQSPDIDQCRKLAEDLEQEESENLTVDSPIINSIFIKSSPQELVTISQEYNKATQKLITQTINEHFKGNAKNLLNAILMAKISPSEYYANIIHESIDDEDVILKVIITRAEIDLAQIKKYYLKLYGNDIVNDIKKDSHEYTNLLVAICNKY
jgi:hypothetical protein